MDSNQIKSWLLAFRLKTLIAAFVPVMVATALVYGLGEHVQLWVSAFALLGATCIQIATNLFNDAIDFKKGADTEDRIGPKRMSQGGLLTEKQIWLMGVFFIILAVLFGAPLVLRGGIPIVIFGVLSLFLAYGYTGGPFPLAYLGLGDLFVILFFGLFAVAGTAYLHTLTLTPPLLVAGLQMGFLSTILIAINNLRDSETDRVVDKKTLAVRFGDQAVKLEILTLFLLSYSINIYYYYLLSSYWLLLPFVSIPLAVFIIMRVFKLKDKSELNKLLGLSALHQVLFSLQLSIGLVLI